MEIKSLLNILPILIISLSILILILIEAFHKKSEIFIYWITILTLIFTTFLSLITIQDQSLNFHDTIESGGITNLFYSLLLIISSLAVISSKNYLNRMQYHHGEYYILVMSAILGMMLMASSRDLMLTFLALELMSLSFYVLAGYHRKVLFNNEASVKYFLLGAFASGFLLYGIALVYGAAQSTNIIYITREFDSLLNKPLFTLGLILLLIGFSFKVASVPFHMWVPDVYEGSPTVVTALMSTSGKIAAFSALIISLYGSTASQINYETVSKIIALLATASMLLGSIVALTQTSLKRMLAYSSIAHAGYMMIGVAAANKIGMAGIIFYLAVYGFMNIGAFILISMLETSMEKRLTLDDLSGIYKTYPWFSAVMALFMFALSGIPPFGGFFGKYYVFISAVKADMTWLAVIGVISSVIAAYFYLRVVIYMYFRREGENQNLYATAAENFIITVCVLFVIQLGITPGVFLNIITRFLP